VSQNKEKGRRVLRRWRVVWQFLGNRQGFDSYWLGEAWARLRKRKEGRKKGDASGGVAAALVKAAMSVRAARLSFIRGFQVRC
jgi:hypothetical protein